MKTSTLRRTIAGILAAGLVMPAGVVPAQAAPPAPPAASPSAQGGEPLPPPDVLAFDRALDQDLHGKVEKLTDRDPATGDTTLMGLVLVRDMYVAQLQKFVTDLDAIQAASDADRLKFLRQLRESARVLDDAYQNMLGTEQAIHTLKIQNPDADPEGYYNSLMKQARAAEKAGDTARAAHLRQEAAENVWGVYLERRKAFLDLLDKHPILGIRAGGLLGLGQSFLFYALRNRLYADAPDSDYLKLVDEFIDSARKEAKAEIDRANGLTEAGDFEEFGGAKYARQRQAVAQLGVRFGSKLPAELVDNVATVYGANSESAAVSSGWTDFWLNIAAGGGWIIPVIGPFITAGAVAVMITRDGADAVVTFLDAKQAAATQAVTGNYYVLTAEQRAAAARGQFVFTVITGLGDIAALRNVRIRLPGARAAEAVEEAARAERLLNEAIPAGKAPGLRAVEDESGILNRLGQDIAGRERAATPPDAAFFRKNGLTPKLTAEVGGQTFHFSKPFRGPGGRTAVIAFQETADGAVLPRVFYLSGEHGVWRAATGSADLIQKGPIRLTDRMGRDVDRATWEQLWMGGQNPEYHFINEGVVDIAAELQGPLHRWVAEQGVVTLDTAAADRAFFGNLERSLPAHEPAEFGAFVKRTDVEHPLPAGGGFQPDFAAGPLDRWTFQHPNYGEVEGFLYKSANGDALYVVLRDSKGQVFVPSVQEGGARLTPFGTRDEAFLTDLTKTPMTHGGDGYVPREFQNALNEAFQRNLPPAQPLHATGATVTPALPAVPGSEVDAAARGATHAATMGGRAISSDDPLLGGFFFPGFVADRAVNSPGSIDPATQMMMLDSILDDSQPVYSGGPGGDARHDDASGPGGALRAIAAWFLAPPGASAAGARLSASAPHAVSLAPLARGVSRRGAADDAAAPAVRMVLTSLGESTGEALQLQIVDDGPRPLRIDRLQMVVEPLKPEAAKAARKALEGFRRSGPQTVNVLGYCLELPKLPPSAGTLFRVAPPDVQQKFDPVRRILNASRALRRSAGLHPDSNPQAYFHSIRQWAVWTRQQGLTEGTFTEAFVRHTEKVVRAAGRAWSDAAERTVRAAAPGRWRDIQAILAQAGRQM